MTVDRERKANHLRRLFKWQGGKCAICREPTVIRDTSHGGKLPDDTAVRFRVGSAYGEKGRVRPKVMVCRRCAQERSDQITESVPIEERWLRSRREPSEFYSLPEGAHRAMARAEQIEDDAN